MKFGLTTTLFALAFSVLAQPTPPEKINWPEDYQPSASKFYVDNEIEINVAPEKVWEVLLDALKWPSWYK